MCGFVWDECEEIDCFIGFVILNCVGDFVYFFRGYVCVVCEGLDFYDFKIFLIREVIVGLW